MIYLVPSILTLASSLLPLLLPMARNLEYEYATLLSYFLLTIPLILFFIPKIKVPRPREALVQIVLSAVLSFLPAFLLFQTQFCLCSENDFRFWWLVQVLPHLLLSHGVAWLMLKGKARGQRWLAAFYSSAILALFLQMAWTLWSLPQKRITHILSGFIHGAIYDNDISVDAGILWARGGHLALGLALLSLAVLYGRKARVFAGLALVIAIFTAWKASLFPSTSHGIAALSELMPESRKGQHFTLHYQAPTSPQGLVLIQQIFSSAEFHTRAIAKQLEVYDANVAIFIYPSRREKKLWFGGDGTDITDVKTPSIHIIAETWPHGSLRHELVHAMASSFAFYGLGFHPNMGFTEGLATALAPSEDEMSLHAGAANILKTQKIDPKTLFSPLFWSESGRRAYTASGSLIKFLIDHYGIAKVKELYSGASWEETFGRESSLVVQEWNNFLNKNYTDRRDDITAEALFRYPGILHDLCPHSKALLASSRKSLLVTMRQPKGWDVQRDYWPWRLELEPGPATRLQVLRDDFSDLGASDELLGLVQRERHDPIKAQEDLEAATLEFDLLIALNRPQEAEILIQKLLSDLERYKIGDGTLRQLWSRKLLSGMSGKTPRAWLALLAGQLAEIPNLEGPPSENPWLINYLFMRNHLFGEKQRALLDALAKRPVPLEIPNSFAVEWWKIIGIKRFELRDFAEAALAFQKAAAIAPEGSRDAILLKAEEAIYTAGGDASFDHKAHH